MLSNQQVELNITSLPKISRYYIYGSPNLYDV